MDALGRKTLPYVSFMDRHYNWMTRRIGDWSYMSKRWSKLKEKLSCNQPVNSPVEGKKKTVKACQDGKEKLLHFGDDNYDHNYSSEAKKNFRARHGCDNAKDKLTRKHWSCSDLWGKTKKIGKK